MKQQRTYYSKEAEMESNRQRIMLALAMVIVGVGIGAVVATLFAPQSGEASREELADNLEEAFNSGKQSTSNALQTLRNEFDRLRHDVEERINR